MYAVHNSGITFRGETSTPDQDYKAYPGLTVQEHTAVDIL